MFVLGGQATGVCICACTITVRCGHNDTVVITVSDYFSFQ